jgi:hypothetical protein
VAGCGLFDGDGPGETLEAFLSAWTAGDDAGAAALTDDPAAATQVLTDARAALSPVGLVAGAGQLREATDRANRVRRRAVGPGRRAGPGATWASWS